VYWADHFALGESEPEKLECSVAGSAFGDGGELRWRLDDGELLVVMLAPGAVPEEPCPTGRLTGITAGEAVEWILAGEWNGSRYVDGRFSEPFDYPRRVGGESPKSGDRLKVSAVPLAEDGRPAFHALKDVQIATGLGGGRGGMP
jgi:hypothetical protein